MTLEISYLFAIRFSALFVCGGKCSLTINVEFFNLFTVKLAQFAPKRQSQRATQQRARCAEWFRSRKQKTSTPIAPLLMHVL